MRSKRKNQIVLIAALWALTVWIEGCGFIVMDRGRVIDEPFTEEKAQSIRNGETTKKDILDWFGPPVAVARAGTVMKVSHWSKSEAASPDVPADDFFKRFSATRDSAQQPLVYYYEAANVDWMELYGFVLDAVAPLYIPFPENRPLTVRKLWILFDEKSGWVIDHQIEKTVEDKPQQKAPKTVIAPTL